MTDIFDNTVFCCKCNSKMQKMTIIKNEFLIRTLACPNCSNKIIHPLDKERYNKYINLRNKEFKVKMRLVGNSYTVSIPKEIVSFIKSQSKMMNEIVNLCFEDMNRLSLSFGELIKKDE